jgi:uncharacterized membrane protein
MSNSQIPQAPDESREAYIARITATAETEWAGRRRLAFNSTLLRGLRAMVIWFFRHWLLLFNLGYALLVAGAFAGPLLNSIGLTDVGNTIFASYGVICDQVPTHSYYPFGFQLCLCQRCLAIYTAMLLGGIYYAIATRSGRRFRPLPFGWLLLFYLPLIVDGLTQLYGLRHSDVFLRTLTGGLFGFATIASLYPWFDAIKRKLFIVLGVEQPAAPVAAPTPVPNQA